LDLEYFNYSRHLAHGWWERRTFLQKWWRLHAADRRWVPPYFPILRRALFTTDGDDPQGSAASLFHLEALSRRRRASGQTENLGFNGPLFEEAVAAAILQEPRVGQANTVFVAGLHTVNHPDVMERWWAESLELLWETGASRVIGPTAFSPYLPGGVLQNYFHLLPPLHTPYNPPYLPELISGIWEPVQEHILYTVDLAAGPAAVSGPATLRPLEPARLAGDLLPLFVAACAPLDLPDPTAEDVRVVLDWLQPGPLSGWVAELEGRPVGFVLLQPDLASALRRAGGGRNPLWRPWLAWRAHRPTRAGRLLYGAVLPQWRGQGIGCQLWQQALAAARAQGWRALTVGPVVAGSAAANFLQRHGAEPRQRYLLYGSEL
jgi:GNAT superfamily N-acetyltransferase